MASRDKQSRYEEASPGLRFEATLGPASHANALAAAADLALDRLPDVDRKVRLLITADDARRLLERGFEIHLLAAHPVAPLDKSLIMTDEQSRQLLEGKVKGIARKGSR